MSAWDATDAGEWLGAEHVEGDRALLVPTALVAHLIEGWKKNLWTEGDVPDEGKVSSADVRIWIAIIDDCDTALTVKTSAGNRARFERWLRAMNKDDAEDEDAAGRYVPSKACLDDMQAQSATTYRDLLFGDVSLYLGRPAGKTDLVDAEYATPPSRSKGGKDAVKYRLPTWDTAMAQAKKEKSTGPLQTFVMQTTNLLSKSDHAFAGEAGTRITQWWMRGERAMGTRGPMAVLAYFDESRIIYRGRFLPELFDPEISTRASGTYGVVTEPATDSQANKDAQTALVSQMGELMKTVNNLASRVGSIAADVGAQVRSPLAGAYLS